MKSMSVETFLITHPRVVFFYLSSYQSANKMIITWLFIINFWPQKIVYRETKTWSVVICYAALKVLLCFPGRAIRTRRDTLRFFCLCVVQVNTASRILRKNKIKTWWIIIKVILNQYINIICMIFQIYAITAKCTTLLSNLNFKKTQKQYFNIYFYILLQV